MQPIFLVYDWFMMHTGLFTIKGKIKKQLFLRRLVREDAALKRQITQKIEQLPSNMLRFTNDASDVIVSLTSYGKRVTDSVPYAIYSIFTQSVLPNRIVLWLDNENWNEDNLPNLLKRLKKSGLEIYYCEDIRSYKKLIPTLRKFPYNPIITVDDDFYYNRDFVKWMIEAYKESDRRTVFATWGCVVEKMDGKYLPYSQWKDCSLGTENSEYSLFGGSGCIYPPNIFDDEMFKSDVFMKLCPTADDIWFWIQEKRSGVKTNLTKYRGYGLHRPIDRVYDYDVAGDGCLTVENVLNRRNDVQLRKLLEYYHLGEMIE